MAAARTYTEVEHAEALALAQQEADEARAEAEAAWHAERERLVSRMHELEASVPQKLEEMEKRMSAKRKEVVSQLLRGTDEGTKLAMEALQTQLEQCQADSRATLAAQRMEKQSEVRRALRQQQAELARLVASKREVVVSLRNAHAAEVAALRQSVEKANRSARAATAAGGQSAAALEERVAELEGKLAMRDAEIASLRQELAMAKRAKEDSREVISALRSFHSSEASRLASEKETTTKLAASLVRTDTVLARMRHREVAAAWSKWRAMLAATERASTARSRGKSVMSRTLRRWRNARMQQAFTVWSKFSIGVAAAEHAAALQREAVAADARMAAAYRAKADVWDKLRAAEARASAAVDAARSAYAMAEAAADAEIARLRAEHDGELDSLRLQVEEQKEALRLADAQVDRLRALCFAEGVNPDDSVEARVRSGYDRERDLYGTGRHGRAPSRGASSIGESTDWYGESSVGGPSARDLTETGTDEETDGGSYAWQSEPSRRGHASAGDTTSATDYVSAGSSDPYEAMRSRAGLPPRPRARRGSDASGESDAPHYGMPAGFYAGRRDSDESSGFDPYKGFSDDERVRSLYLQGGRADALSEGSRDGADGLRSQLLLEGKRRAVGSATDRINDLLESSSLYN